MEIRSSLKISPTAQGHQSKLHQKRTGLENGKVRGLMGRREGDRRGSILRHLSAEKKRASIRRSRPGEMKCNVSEFSGDIHGAYTVDMCAAMGGGAMNRLLRRRCDRDLKALYAGRERAERISKESFGNRNIKRMPTKPRHQYKIREDLE
jgi:hypothetical protein